ncbi:recombinase family protein [Schleiferilactobacillus harbinensis]|nr:recombinase family protein [Schleiferilactobacillus harbinensis]
MFAFFYKIMYNNDGHLIDTGNEDFCMRIGFTQGDPADCDFRQQIVTLTATGVDRLFLEETAVPGTIGNQLHEMLDSLQADDVVVIPSLAALSASNTQLIELIDQIYQKNAVLDVLDLRTFQQNTTLKMQRILTATVLESLRYAQKMERKRRREQQRKGIISAQAAGRYRGKQLEYSDTAPDPKKREIYHQIVSLLQATPRVGVSEIMHRTGVARQTVYNIKHRLEKK